MGFGDFVKMECTFSIALEESFREVVSEKLSSDAEGTTSDSRPVSDVVLAKLYVTYGSSAHPSLRRF